MRAPVCLTCGDKGNTTLLIYCRNCRDSAVHHYCLNNVSPSDDNIIWLCWDCDSNECINEPSRKSEQNSCKQQKVHTIKKQTLEEGERLVHISHAPETDKPATDHFYLVEDVDSPREVDFQEERKSRSEIPRCFNGPTESITTNEPTFATRGTYPIQEEDGTNSLQEIRKVEEVQKQRSIMRINDCESSNDEAVSAILQPPSLGANDHVVSSQILCGEAFSEPEDIVSAEPILEPKWRGWFNFKEENEEDETCVEILAHVSNKACSKVFDATSAMPYMLDFQILEKSAIWPKCFRASPPNAASIALYFFPAHERDERMYDSLLDNIIQKELALKATIGNVELLIFSSYELPLPHRRLSGKYFFWGVFKKKHGSRLSSGYMYNPLVSE